MEERDKQTSQADSTAGNSNFITLERAQELRRNQELMLKKLKLSLARRFGRRKKRRDRRISP